MGTGSSQMVAEHLIWDALWLMVSRISYIGPWDQRIVGKSKPNPQLVWGGGPCFHAQGLEACFVDQASRCGRRASDRAVQWSHG